MRSLRASRCILVRDVTAQGPLAECRSVVRGTGGLALSDCDRNFVIVLFAEYYYGDKIEKDKMCGACSTHESAGECIQNFSPEV
jgi:hypothetical protein